MFLRPLGVINFLIASGATFSVPLALLYSSTVSLLSRVKTLVQLQTIK
jgi:hypothetical protein